MNSSEDFKNHLLRAKRLYKQEKSYPLVYRELIRDLDADVAILVLEELRLINTSDKVFA